jgi:predicted nuclease with TOPRIM domain
VENLPIDDLVDLTARLAKTRMDMTQLREQNQDQDQERSRLLEENSRLGLEVERQRSAILRARDLQEELEKKIRLLQNEVTALHQVNTKNLHKGKIAEVQKIENNPTKDFHVIEPGEATSLNKWQQKGTSKRDTEVLRLLGETGLSVDQRSKRGLVNCLGSMRKAGVFAPA